MRADCFFRAWHRDLERMLSPRNVRCISVEVPADASLEKILEAASKAGAPKGNCFSGIYEVQTDRGIFRRDDERKLDLSTPRRAAKVVFKSWEELEAEEINHGKESKEGVEGIHRFEGGLHPLAVDRHAGQ